jgi:hypothetical protein
VNFLPQFDPAGHRCSERRSTNFRHCAAVRPGDAWLSTLPPQQQRKRFEAAVIASKAAIQTIRNKDAVCAAVLMKRGWRAPDQQRWRAAMPIKRTPALRLHAKSIPQHPCGFPATFA